MPDPQTEYRDNLEADGWHESPAIVTDEPGVVSVVWHIEDLDPAFVGISGHGALVTAAEAHVRRKGHRVTGAAMVRRLELPPRIRVTFGRDT